MIVSIDKYFTGVDFVCGVVDGKGFDCIVALKRSGWILGAIMSNKLNIPVFTVSEIDSIPAHFKTILIVDDKIHKGKAVQQVKNKLNKINKESKTCCIFVQGKIKPDFFFEELGSINKMFYEI